MSLPLDPDRALRSKISRLPFKVREHVNEMLLDGDEGGTIIAWLESQGVTGINHPNLTAWRKSGYAAWLVDKRKITAMQQRGEYSLRLAEAGGADVSSGAAAVAGGQIFDAIADTDEINLDDDEGRAKMMSIVAAVTSLQKSASQDRRARIAERQLDQRDRQLDQREREIQLSEEKFRRMAAEKIMEAAKSPEVQAILGDGSLNRDQQLKAIEQLMFGDQVPEF